MCTNFLAEYINECLLCAVPTLFSSHDDAEDTCYDHVRAVAHPLEVMFRDLLNVSQASNMELVSKFFTVGPGLFILSETTSDISFHVATVHCM